MYFSPKVGRYLGEQGQEVPRASVYVATYGDGKDQPRASWLKLKNAG